MKISKLLSLLTISVVLLYFSTNSGCTKEHTCEGCLIGDTFPPGDATTPQDTTKIDSTLNFPVCSNCDSTQPLALNSWSFSFNNSYVCGTVDSSLFSTEKESFDFWGKLQCFNDTIFRYVVFFDSLKFDTDRFNVSTNNQAFMIQDGLNYMDPWNGMILRTDFLTPWHSIKVSVDTFINSTKLMVGRFNGYAYTKNNERVYVDGKFRFIVQ